MSIAIPTTVAKSTSLTRATDDRFPCLDLTRFFAAMAVIWIHAATSDALVDSTRLARFAVPFFIATAAFFTVYKPTRNRSWIGFVQSKLVRLYGPFVVWSVVYFALKLLKRFLVPSAPCELGSVWFFVEGTAYHLWFIPFLLIATCVLFALNLWLSEHARWNHAVAYLLATTGLLLVLPLHRYPLIDANFTWMLLATPSLLWGAALGIAARSDSSSLQQRPFLATLAVASFVVLLVMTARQSQRNPILENGAGLLIMIAALWAPALAVPHWLLALGRCSFGIYLSHLLFIKVLEPVFAKLGTGPSPLQDVTIFGIALMCAAGVSYLLSQYRRTRWLVC